MTTFKNIFTSIFIIGIFALHPSLNKGKNPITYLHYFVYGNSFNLTSNDIDRNLLMVKWSCENLPSDCKELVIYEKGKKINDIPFEKGNQQLAVYYNNRLIGTIRQNKKIKAQSHNYKLSVVAKEENIEFKAEIIGPSPNKSSQVFSVSDIVLAKK